MTIQGVTVSPGDLIGTFTNVGIVIFISLDGWARVLWSDQKITTFVHIHESHVRKLG